MTERRYVVLDVDVGIDDALMMLMLLSEPSVEVVAVGSTHGNCTAADAALNALRVLEAVGAGTIPVALGPESPLDPPHQASHVHGHDGLADLGLPSPKGSITGESAPEQLVRLGTERPGELDLIAVGPLTNLAAALALDPDALSRYRSIAWLGGVSLAPAEALVNDYYDANTLSDPEAARTVLSSDVPIMVIPIDLSYRAILSDEQLDAIKSSTTPQARFAWKILPFYNDFYEPWIGRWTSCMHDPIAGAIAIAPSLSTHAVERSIVLEPYKDRIHAHGQPQPIVGSPPKCIVVDADVPRFLDYFVERLLGPVNPVYGRE
ncbi:MAG: nucleoside hydrolase [Thermomicrobiales bacterium]|nr:nucleoside hydrolase [Thermomicrobiales bacterium]MCO5222151.1 nucleoside hydrolase [Thermomicrobiales bacterium]